MKVADSVGVAVADEEFHCRGQFGMLHRDRPNEEDLRDAEAVLDENVAAQEHMLEAYPNLKSMYKPGDGNTEVYYLKNAAAQICSFTEPAREIKF